MGVCAEALAVLTILPLCVFGGLFLIFVYGVVYQARGKLGLFFGAQGW